MEKFLKEIIEDNVFEILIDKDIFSKDIVLKASYNFLDRWYFFFRLDKDYNIILQFTKKDDSNENPKNILDDFSDEMLSVLLRDNLEKENKNIREAIVWAAIWNCLDSNNFVEINTDKQESNQIDFDKDIDDILKDIENDPDLKIDEEEIENILKEIEEESKVDIKIDPEGLKKAKESFNK